MKPNRNPDFVYEVAAVGRGDWQSRSADRQERSGTPQKYSSSICNLPGRAAVRWSDLHLYAHTAEEEASSVSLPLFCDGLRGGSRSLSHLPTTVSDAVFKSPVLSTIQSAVQRRTVSERCDSPLFSYSWWQKSPIVLPNTCDRVFLSVSDMSELEDLGSEMFNSAVFGASNADTASTSKVLLEPEALAQAIAKMDKLTKTVESQGNTIRILAEAVSSLMPDKETDSDDSAAVEKQKVKSKSKQKSKMVINSDAESVFGAASVKSKLKSSKKTSQGFIVEDDSDTAASKRKSKKSKHSLISEGESIYSSGSDSDKSKKGSKSKSKKSQVLKERKRQLKVAREKVRNQKDSSDSENQESSEEEVNLPKIKKKMTKSQREEASSKLAGLLKRAGFTFPDEDYETEETSGTDSSCSNSCSNSRKVKIKSGSKVKKRPVKRQELWPHTIANEESWEDTSSENISLAKFMTCFTTIMSVCGGVEAIGRTNFLKSIL